MRFKNMSSLWKYFKTNWFYVLIAAILLVYVGIEARGPADFDIFLSASKDLLLHKNIYTEHYHQWYHYYYDVPFALLMLPFRYMPHYLACYIYLLINVFFFYRITKIINGYLPLSMLDKKSYKPFLALSIIFILRFFKDNMHLGQLTIFILFLALEGINKIHQNKKISGSLLLAIGINIKLLPILLIPYLFYRNEWKAGLFAIVFMIILLILPGMIIGFDYNQFLLMERWHIINPMNQEHILDTSERSFHSLTTLLSTLFISNTGDFHELNIKRNIADISIQNLNVIINIVRGILILFSLYFLRTLPIKSIKNRLQLLYEMSYIFLITPLLFPHQQYYAFLFIFPASSYLIFYLISIYFNKNMVSNHMNDKRKKTRLIILLTLCFLMTSCHLILGQFDDYYDHFKVLTYGVLLLMITLAIYTPSRLNQILQDA
jgi:hypothetical protein